mmetsp:Transcript_32930/g.33539  ORF Transcript_32930/g.33539 Transcript_32930/m.33539 type:complete len:256 (-) Transcript_32930:184-951(-)
MFRLHRYVLLSSGAIAVTAISQSRRPIYCNSSQPQWPFDSKGLSYQKPASATKCPDPMSLAAVGVRKKNLYVVGVDVYVAGLSLDLRILQYTSAWFQSKRDKPLIETLINPPMDDVTNKQPAPTDAKIVISLRFLRNVSTKQMTKAFEDSFKSYPQEAMSLFFTGLVNTVGEKGIKKGDELTYTWLYNGEFIISKNDDLKWVIKNDIVARALLEMYVSPEKSITPDLTQCLEKHVTKIHKIARLQSVSNTLETRV